MDINEQTFHRIEKAYGASLIKAKNDKFAEIMSAESADDCSKVLAWLKIEREFYSKVMKEEYRKKNPNSNRYKEADNLVPIINEKGKLLKSIIDQKQQNHE